MKQPTIPMPRFRAAAHAAILTLVVSACAGASMDTGPGPSYALSVINEMPHAMIVSLDDGSGTRLLGTVGAGSTARFVLHGSASVTVTLIATDEEDTHTVRRTVVLRSDRAVEVRLN